MISLFAEWQPMGGAIWFVGSGVGQIVVYSLYVIGGCWCCMPRF